MLAASELVFTPVFALSVETKPFEMNTFHMNI